MPVTSETEKKVRNLKAAIKRAQSPLTRQNLQFKLNALVRDLAKREFQEKASRFIGNSF